jgi:hypothetical protein
MTHLVAERLGQRDPTARGPLEHAEDLVDLLEDLSKD